MDKLKELATMKNIFVVALIAVILILTTCSGPESKVVTVIQPEYRTITDTIVVNKIEYKTVKVKDGVVVVDKDKYEGYVSTTDSIKKKQILINAITIRDHKTVVVDNDTVRVEVNSKVQGELISLNADVTVKKQEVRQLIVKQRPRLSLILGAEVGYRDFKFNPLIKTGIQTKSGNIFTASVDVNKNVYIGFAKTFTIIK